MSTEIPADLADALRPFVLTAQRADSAAREADPDFREVDERPNEQAMRIWQDAISDTTTGPNVYEYRVLLAAARKHGLWYRRGAKKRRRGVGNLIRLLKGLGQ